MNAKPEMTALSPAWLVPSDQYGWSAVLRNVLPFFLLLWFIPQAAPVTKIVVTQVDVVSAMR